MINSVHTDVSESTNFSLRTPWREALLQVADMDPWGGVKREQRPEWRVYLKQAEILLQSPRKPLPKVRIQILTVPKV